MMRKSSGITSLGTTRTFLKVGSCSETLFHVLNRAFDQSFQHEEHAALLLAGGIMQRGYQCGLLWGAALAAGTQAYRMYGSGARGETMALLAAQRLVSLFQTQNREIDCRALTHADWRKPGQILRYFLMGGPVRCFRMAARFAPAASREINNSFAANRSLDSALPVSCAAVLARMMGVDEALAVMAAGLAGGIGLSGGGCGALGAAIWITGVRDVNAAGGKMDYKNPHAEAVIERFTQRSGGEMQCAKIVGRMFESVEDHADYLREGGCAKIIDGLAGR